MRNSRSNLRKSEDDKFSDILLSLSKILERLERLELQVFEMSFAEESEAPPKRGRKRKISTEEILNRRQMMVSWLEFEWPELSIALKSAKSEDDAVNAIIEAKGEGGHPFQGPFYRKPERFGGQLWEFLQSKRYRENPRNLAAAMSGLPEIGWKRSFDICSAYPMGSGGMHLRGYRDYLRRKFPDRLKALLKAATTEEITEILKSSRSKDLILQHLLRNPERVKNWLEAGRPGNKNLLIEVGGN